MDFPLTSEQKKKLFEIMKRQDERGRESTTMVMGEFKAALDLYGPLLDSGLLTYERFGAGDEALVSLIIQPDGLKYCQKNYNELSAL